MCQPLEDHVQRATSVNLARHIHWVADVERTILTKERLLALFVQLDIFVQKTQLTLTPILVHRVISAQMVLSIPHNTHVLKGITMVP